MTIKVVWTHTLFVLLFLGLVSGLAASGPCAPLETIAGIRPGLVTGMPPGPGYLGQGIPVIPGGRSLDPQDLLDVMVARNNGSGGGVFRIGMSSNGRVLWEGASGDLFRDGDPMQVDADFEIASTSKTFTAAAVLLLVEQGILDLDAPVSLYLPPEYTHGLLVIDGHDYGPELTL